MAITVDTAREMVRNALRETPNGIDKYALDRAIKVACDTLILETEITRTDATVALTANDASVTVSGLTNFRVDRLIKAELRGSDQGTWTTATAYSKHDIVTGDGDPDSLKYRCTVAHTSSSSNEPGSSGGSANWTRVNWDRIEDLVEADYTSVARKLNDSVQAGTPSCIGFADNATAYLWPVPDSAFTLGLIYKAALVSWNDGGPGGATTLNIDDEYLRPTLWWGAAACVSHADPGDVFQDERWRRFMDFVFKVRGKSGYNASVAYKNEEAFV